MSGPGRTAIPARVGGRSVRVTQLAMARALTEAVRAKLERGDLTLDDLTARMRSKEHVVKRLLVEPERVVSLRYVAALALAAGLRVRLEVEA